MGLWNLLTNKKNTVEVDDEPCPFLPSFFENASLFGVEYDQFLPKLRKFVIYLLGSSELVDSLLRPNSNIIGDNEFYFPIYYPDTLEEKSGAQIMLDYCLDIIFPGYREKNEAEGRYILVKDKYDENNKIVNQYTPGIRNVKFGIRRKTKDGINRTLEKHAGLELLMLLASSRGLVDFFTRYFGRLVIDDMNYILKDNDKESDVKLCVAKYGVNGPVMIEFIFLKSKTELESAEAGEEIEDDGNTCDIVVNLPLDIY